MWNGDPKPGLVVWYAFMWRDELREGFDRPAKHRPAMILHVSKGRTADAPQRVFLLPITHASQISKRGILIPTSDLLNLALDVKDRSVVVTDNVNIADWPLRDMAPRVPGVDRSAVLGSMSRDVLMRSLDEFKAAREAKLVKAIDREKLRKAQEAEALKWRSAQRGDQKDDEDEPEPMI